jgi:hypothetical protein
MARTSTFCCLNTPTIQSSSMTPAAKKPTAEFISNTCILHPSHFALTFFNANAGYFPNSMQDICQILHLDKGLSPFRLNRTHSPDLYARFERMWTVAVYQAFSISSHYHNCQTGLVCFFDVHTHISKFSYLSCLFDRVSLVRVFDHSQRGYISCVTQINGRRPVYVLQTPFLPMAQSRY